MELIFSSYQQAGLFGSVIIALVLILRCLLKRTPRKYLCLMWLLVAVRLLIPFHFEHKLSLQPDLDDFQSVQIEFQEQELSQQEITQQPTGSVEGEVFFEEEPLIPAEPVKMDYSQLNAIIWLAMAGVLVLYFVISYGCLRYRLRDAVLCGENILESDRIQGGFLIGYFKPRIYLPVLAGESERQMMILHEQAHAARGDNWWKLMAFFCCCIHWYNPVVWLGYFFVCRDIEIACDERVISGMDGEERKRYSTALLSCGKRSAGFFACPVAFGEISLKQRIKNVLSYRRAKPFVVVATWLAVVFLTVFFMTSPVQGTGEEPDLSQQGQTNVEATQPTEETSQPTEEPTQPTEEPTQPTEETTELTEETTQPTEDTSQPTEEPTEPTEERTQATEEPTEPSEETTQATEETSQPTEAECQHSYGSGEVEIAATCSEEGIKKYICTVCGVVKRESIPKVAHILEDTTVTKEPNCTKKGEMVGTCSVCGAEPLTQVMPTNGTHIFADTVVREATCTSTGEGIKTCKLCGHSEPCQYAIKQHTYGNETVLTEATCTAEGEKGLSCVDCGHTVKETIPKAEHKWTGASCTQAGVCSVCNATGKKEEHKYIILLDQNIEKGHAAKQVSKCEVCQAKKTRYSTESYVYNLDVIGAEIGEYARNQGFQVRLGNVNQPEYQYVASAYELDESGGPDALVSGAKEQIDEAGKAYGTTSNNVADIYVYYTNNGSISGEFGVHIKISGS